MDYYHYTLGIKLPDIFTEGFLRTSPREPRYPERPVVWLSSNPEYERSALKIGVRPDGTAQSLTLEAMAAHGRGVFRFRLIEVPPDNPVLPWDLLKSRAKMPEKLRRRLIERARECGANPREWFGTLAPIAVEHLLLESLDAEGRWIVVDTLDAASLRNPAVRQATLNELGLVIPKGKFTPGESF